MPLSNVFIAGSILLAFAYYCPTYVFQLYFIFPVQAKYLALLSLFISTLAFINGGPAAKIETTAALSNYLLFLGPSMWRDFKSGRRHRAWHSRLRADQRETAAAGPRHRCATCGKNSETHPDEDFRYTADDRCFCAEHLPSRRVPSAGPSSRP
jgi:hypothetical protein